MREMLKNDLLMLLNNNVTTDLLRQLEPEIELILSNYEIVERQTEVILYGSDIPETVETYIVSKKISGLSDKSLYSRPHHLHANFTAPVMKRKLFS